MILLIVAALVLGGWRGWLLFDERRDLRASREDIEEACDGLVTPDAVLDLDGGVVRVKTTDSVWWDGEVSTPGSSCRVARVKDSGASRSHFQLVLLPRPSSRDNTPVSVYRHRPFEETEIDEPLKDLTREMRRPVAQPLGDGTLGYYTDDTVTIWAKCGASSAGEAEALSVTASAQYEAVSDEDRRTLVGLAIEAIESAAEDYACALSLPEPPERLPAVPRELVAADQATGTCSWYARFIEGSGRGRLPDRALGTGEAPSGWQETCVLGVSQDRTVALWPERKAMVGDESSRQKMNHVLRYRPWWMKTGTYFGEQAKQVYAQELDDGPIPPGTAGGYWTVWWASSVCEGEPAIHIASVELGYRPLVQDRLPALFRAYVTDVTERRGCTDLVFPKESDFR